MTDTITITPEEVAGLLADYRSVRALIEEDNLTDQLAAMVPLQNKAFRMARLIATQAAENKRLRGLVTDLCDTFDQCHWHKGDPRDRGYSPVADKVATARAALEQEGG